MMAKYKIEYAVPFRGHDQPHHYVSDDPVACEEFLTELLERGFKITGILHEGIALPKVDSDKMIKTAAGMLATKHICRSLGMSTPPSASSLRVACLAPITNDDPWLAKSPLSDPRVSTTPGAPIDSRAAGGASM